MVIVLIVNEMAFSSAAFDTTMSALFGLHVIKSVDVILKSLS